MSNDAVHPDSTTGPASPVVPPRRNLEALSLLSTDHHLAHTAAALAERFAGVFSPETVAACLVESHELLSTTAKITTHLTVLSGGSPASA